MPYADYEKHKENARQNYYKNKEKRLKQVHEYYDKNWEKRRIQKRKWYLKNKEKNKEYYKKYFKKYRLKTIEKNKARDRLNGAIRYGKIKRPHICSNCKMNGLIDAHHFDYSKPLDVIWLCRMCHSRKHHNRYHRGGELHVDYIK